MILVGNVPKIAFMVSKRKLVHCTLVRIMFEQGGAGASDWDQCLKLVIEIFTQSKMLLN